MTPREQSSSAPPTKRDHRQEVTDSIVKMLEDGVAPWQKPWESAGMPFNPTTDKAYRGGNAFHLMATGLSQGYEDPRWMPERLQPKPKAATTGGRSSARPNCISFKGYRPSPRLLT